MNEYGRKRVPKFYAINDDGGSTHQVPTALVLRSSRDAAPVASRRMQETRIVCESKKAAGRVLEGGTNWDPLNWSEFPKTN
jgi:hypothetical protein